MRLRAIGPALACLAWIASCGAPEVPTNPLAKQAGVAPVSGWDRSRVVTGQTIYVPAYSFVRTADNGQELNLATTLFVRNTDPEVSMVVVKVGYHGSGGRLVRDLIEGPIRVDPLATAEFFVKESDVSGGASPSFLVEWVAEKAIAHPVAESVMIGTVGTQGISFLSTGRVVRPGEP